MGQLKYVRLHIHGATCDVLGWLHCWNSQHRQCRELWETGASATTNTGNRSLYYHKYRKPEPPACY